LSVDRVGEISNLDREIVGIVTSFRSFLASLAVPSVAFVHHLLLALFASGVVEWPFAAQDLKNLPLNFEV
jgi:hypothetical protein